MAAVTIHNNFGAQENNLYTLVALFHPFSHPWAMLIASDLLCSLLGFVFFEMALYVFLLGHANGTDYVDASVPESSGLCHPALPP